MYRRLRHRLHRHSAIGNGDLADDIRGIPANDEPSPEHANDRRSDRHGQRMFGVMCDRDQGFTNDRHVPMSLTETIGNRQRTCRSQQHRGTVGERNGGTLRIAGRIDTRVGACITGETAALEVRNRRERYSTPGEHTKTEELTNVTNAPKAPRRARFDASRYKEIFR